MTAKTKYTLQYPVEFDGKTVSEIEFSRPKGRDIKRLTTESSLEDLMGVAANVSEYTPMFFDNLDAADYLGVSEVMGNFLDSGQTAG